MNILIRPLSIDDAAISYKWRNNPEIWKHTGAQYSTEISEEIESDWLKGTLGDVSKSRFAILVDHEYVGNVQLTDIQVKDTAQFHIFIGNQAYWGKGVAKEATYQILVYAKEVLQLRSVFLEVKEENIAAVKAYEKNGFIVTDTTNDFLIMNCNLQHLPPPMVSIFCLVYNHEPFIAQTLEGFLMQKNNFTTQIVLGEDCSTDGSRAVILEYAQKYPGKFKLLLHDVNIGALNNQQMVFEHCDGKYIAMCEGDDYWTDPLKLQKQVDFLEHNPDFSVSFTNTAIVNEFSEIIDEKSIPNFEKSIYTHLDMPIFAPTLTRVMRNVFTDKERIKDLNADTMVLVWASKFGKLHYLDEVTSAYRKHQGGVWSLSSELAKKKMFIKSRLNCLKIVAPVLYIKFYKAIYIQLLNLKKSSDDVEDYIQETMVQFKQYQLMHNNHLSFKQKIFLPIINVLVVHALQSGFYHKLVKKLIYTL